MGIEVAIKAHEWEQATQLLTAIGGDERRPEGLLWLMSDGTTRQWRATNGRHSISVREHVPGPAFEVGLPASLVVFADRSTADRLEIFDRDGWPKLAVSGPDGRMEIDDPDHAEPPGTPATLTGDLLGGFAEIENRPFYIAIQAATTPRGVSEDGSPATSAIVAIGVADGEFGVGSDDAGFGSTRVFPETTHAAGDAVVTVSGQGLMALLSLLSPVDRLRVEVPQFEGDALVIVSGDTVLTLLPTPTRRQQTEAHVEEVIEQVCGRLAVRRDSDGDYRLLRHDVNVYARLLGEDSLQVFGVLMRDVAATPELLSELNEMNANISFTRIFHVDDQVLAEVDLVPVSLDAHELRTAINQIRDVALEIIPTLATVFGGSVVEDPARIRAAMYRDTIIDAEVTPGHLTALNGPGAAVEWPFPGPVHVITGWNPQGVALTESEGDHFNRQIAQDVMRHGGRFVLGYGRSRDGGYLEASVVAWGLSRESAVRMGSKALQDAIFEIDADEIRLLSCVDDQVDAWARHL